MRDTKEQNRAFLPAARYFWLCLLLVSLIFFYPVCSCADGPQEQSDQTQSNNEEGTADKTADADTDASTSTDTNSDNGSSPDTSKDPTWPEALSSVKLTGNYAADLLMIAQTQLGYTESSTDYNIQPDGAKNGYSMYGAWAGDPYADWCAIFVSYCLENAKVPTEAFPRSSVCQDWIDVLSGNDYGLYHADSEPDKEAGTNDKTKKPGDLIFFDWDLDGVADHVGIIAGFSDAASGELSTADQKQILDDTVTELLDTNALADSAAKATETPSDYSSLVTINGNYTDMVRLDCFDKNDPAILGWASLPAANADSNNDGNDQSPADQSTGEPADDNNGDPADQSTANDQNPTPQESTPAATIKPGVVAAIIAGVVLVAVCAGVARALLQRQAQIDRLCKELSGRKLPPLRSGPGAAQK